MKGKKLFARLLAAVLVAIMAISLAPTSYAAGGDSETLTGWTLGEGYSVTSTWVYEGSYALEHTGTASEAVSEDIMLEDGVSYIVEGYVRPADSDASVSIDFAGQTLASTGNGAWEKLSVVVLGSGANEKFTINAVGTAQIDGIAVRPFKEGENLLTNGDMSTSSVPFTGGQWLAEFEGASGVLKEPASGEVARGMNNISVEKGEYYLVSINVYMEENPPWAYVDMNDRAGEVQLRGTKIGEWHNVSAVWQADTTSVPLRLVVENNWDNPNSGAVGTGAVYFDEVSIKKVTLYEDLISDEGFEIYDGDSYEWVTVNTTDSSVTADAATNKSSYEDPERAGCPTYVNNDSMNIQSWAEFKFTGSQFSILGSCSLDCCAVDIYIDGATTPVARVDLAKNPWQVAEVYVSEELTEGEHTVRLTPALRGETVCFPEGTQYGSSFTRTYCGIDAFKYKKLISSGSSKTGSPWLLNDGSSQTVGSYYLFGSHALKLTGKSSAVANEGNVINVEPNCYYFYSAWRLRPGDANTDGSIVIKSADGSTTLASITGSRYNQTMWNPAEGTNLAEKQTAHWEQIYGFWFSGDNTQVKIYAESTGTGSIYFDDVTFNKFENRAAQKSIFENGDMEGFIPDAEDLLPSAQEKERVKDQYESFLADNLKNFPTSFKIADKQYYGFGEDFTLTSQTTEDVYREAFDKVVGKKTITKLTHTSGLIFTVESVLYEDYNAYDWTLYAQQPENADANSPVISDWNAIDYTWEGEAPKLTGTVGDHAAYEPYTNYVEGKLRKSSNSGRGTSGDSSYFNFQYGDKGIMMAVGWPGYWELELDNSNDSNLTNMTAGQVELNTYLEPGETIRTPLMAFVHYNGRNEDRSTNLWRSWFIDCNMNTITPDAEGNEKEELPEAGIYAATSIQWHEMTRATTENQITAIDYYLSNDINLTYWWMDAGWYYKLDGNGNYQTLNDWGWTDTGVWIADADRFNCQHDGEPHGALYDISAYAEENGIRTLLWFEPERIANRSMLVDDATDRVSYSDNTTIHPSWILDGGSWPILDMGNEDAVNWMLNRILTVMKDGGIDMYREDFNTDPLSNWETADKAKDSSGNRKGITENLYIQGHLSMWDSILEEIPNATIDCCASGGNRNDLESMRRGIPLHKTDHAYGDQTWQQNSEAFFQKWIPYVGTKANGESEANDNTTTANRYSLRTALVGGMVLGYNTDSENAPVDWDIIEDITEEHKAISHLLYSDYYVLEDWSSSGSDWSAWQYFDQDLQEGYLIAFRRENASATRTYYLKGLDKETEYKIWFEDANKPVVRTGIDLMKNGVEVTVPVAMGSDILHIEKADQAQDDRSLTSIISQVSFNGQYQGAICEIDNINLSKYNSGNGESAMYQALKDDNAGYSRFDIHFNMSLRDTALTTGTVESDVEDDYKDLITIDGQKVSEILAKDADAVYMDYDALNNILNIYMKNDLLKKTENHEVVLSKDLSTDGDADIEGSTPWTYTASTGEWTKGTVTDGLVKSITVSGQAEMIVKSNQTLTAVVSPDTAENKDVTWSSSDEKIATVDKDGKVTAVKVGTVTITATATDGTNIKGTFDINVNPILTEEITVNGDKEMTLGDDQTLTATVEPEDTTNPAVTWSSSDGKIATVDKDGKVIAVKVGTVTITATATDGSEVKGTFDINVNPILTEEITVNGDKEMTVGDDQTLTATVEPEDTTNPAVIWSSSDEKVATVDKDGKVTAVKDGKVTITATSTDGSEVKGTFDINVNPILTEEITVNGDKEMTVGDNQTLIATVEPENTTYPAVTWSSSDEKIATVDKDGKVTAVKDGKVTITATATDGSEVKGTFEITVKPVLTEKNDVAPTGDGINLVLWISVAVVSVGAIVTVTIFKNRKAANK